jgi:hypothetical protein
MTARAAALGAAAFVLCAGLLSGCVAALPPGPSAEQLASHRAETLRLTWANTGLTGDPPVVEGRYSTSDTDWFRSIGDCLSEAGVASPGWSYSTGAGYALAASPGLDLDDDAQQLAFYICVASYNPPREYDGVLSEAQLDYLYDYYQDWLVPCLTMRGYRFTDVPTRTEFKVIAGQWSPFYSVDISISGADYDELERLCGAERPQLY